ncbi:hypothetical protein LXL04_035134 [Taraxacum kok-saghyz]
MFVVTARLTCKNVPTWHHLYNVCEIIPIRLYGNKVDLNNRQVKSKRVTFHKIKNLQYSEISTKSSYNFEKPFFYLTRKLVRYFSFVFFSIHLTTLMTPPLAPPEVQIHIAAEQRWGLHENHLFGHILRYSNKLSNNGHDKLSFVCGNGRLRRYVEGTEANLDLCINIPFMVAKLRMKYKNKCNCNVPNF